MFCFISFNFVVCFNQWFCQTLYVYIAMVFFMSKNINWLYFGISIDITAFFACLSASSFPFILQWLGIYIRVTILFECFSSWIVLIIVEEILSWKGFCKLCIVLKEFVNILYFWLGLLLIYLRVVKMASASGVYIEFWFDKLREIFSLFVMTTMPTHMFTFGSICVNVGGIVFDVLEKIWGKMMSRFYFLYTFQVQYLN
jgi:hypothetical protein